MTAAINVTVKIKVCYGDHCHYPNDVTFEMLELHWNVVSATMKISLSAIVCVALNAIVLISYIATCLYI